LPRPKRDQQVPDMAGAIKEAAWVQIAADGAPGLSLRAIARQLGITAPAIYNYFPSRDDLVTALVIDAYASFAEALIAGNDSLPEKDFEGRIKATGEAYYRWAMDYPQRYQLLFGPALPGYKIPLDEVLSTSTRSMGVLIGIVEAIRRAGKLRESGIPEPDEITGEYIAMLNMLGIPAQPQSLTIAVLIWSRVHGLVSLELSGNLSRAECKALLNYELDSISKQFISRGE
jgi:AcrR family transcriptional regulator